ncbi:hypothetical protein [Pseudomonas sp. NPDC090201]|uniref:hypothetical protein n=1 Tax=Pseudomonas sp. NPDC090201 TaxID=3364475 RepID=UPI003813EB02
MKAMEFKPTTISELQSYLGNLYSVSNNNHSFEYIYGYLTRNCSYLSRAILRKKDDSDYFVKSFSWLFALASKLEINIEEAFRKKFPEKCPYCVSLQCVCATTGKAPPAHKSEWEIKEELATAYQLLINNANTRHLVIDGAVTKINEIYPGNRAIWSVYGSSYHFSRLFEELGEVHEAYGAHVQKNRSIDLIREELADVLAWLLSAWGIASPAKRLSNAFIEYYYTGCPVCSSNPCNCPNYSSRDQAIVNPVQLEQFKALINEITTHLPNNIPELSQIAENIDQLKETDSTTDAKRVLAQSVEVLDAIQSGTDKAVKVTENVKSLITSAILFVNSLTWFG